MQVLLGYGLYTNLELLEHYGFLLTNNPNDKVFILLSPDMNLNTSWTKDLLYIDRNGEPSFALLSSLRVWATPPSQRKSVSHLAYSGLQLSNQNETVVMKWLVKKCHDLLNTLPTSAEEDFLLLQALDKAHCLGDLININLSHHTLDHEVQSFLKLHHLPDGAQLYDKLQKSIDTWKLAILWRLGYKKILRKCITYCSETLHAFERQL